MRQPHAPRRVAGLGCRGGAVVSPGCGTTVMPGRPKRPAPCSVTVTVTVAATPLAPMPIPAGGSFELAFPLPASVVGAPAMPVMIEVSRTFRAGADIRDLGLAFGEFEVR